jgi:hypothetical protein
MHYVCSPSSLFFPAACSIAPGMEDSRGRPEPSPPLCDRNDYVNFNHLPSRVSGALFHNEYAISTAKIFSTPRFPEGLWATISFNGRAIFQQKRVAHDLQETRRRESRTVSERLSQRGVVPEARRETRAPLAGHDRLRNNSVVAWDRTRPSKNRSEGRSHRDRPFALSGRG